MASWRSIASLLIVLALCSCASRSHLPQLGSVAPFTLTDQTNTGFDSASLQGHVWIADFMFTNCPGPCPRMTSQMNSIRLELEKEGIRLVSFTVDPERDTPQVLAEFAARYHAPPATWRFLTGPQAELHRLSFNVFKLGSVDGSLEHSTRFVLVDRTGQIRGYYATLEDGAIPKVIEDARGLLQEES